MSYLIEEVDYQVNNLAKKDFEQYVGKHIYIEKANGKKVKGKLVAVEGNRIFLAPLSVDNNKKVETKFIFCFLIFGLIAVGLLAVLVCSCCGARRGSGCGCGCGFRRRRHCGCNRCRGRGRRRFHRRRRYA